ncbi:MAG: FAD:protein FMN transferase [Clostridiaceae bacterium]|nr:FAD:protein FMN transferase [Clostridiaceae bacterium]
MKRLIFCMVFILIITSSCIKKNPESVSRSDFLLNTIVEISLYEDEKTSNQMLDEMFEEIRRCENKYSRYTQESEMARINENRGCQVKVSEDTMEIIEKSLYFSEISGGLFDITIGALVDLWNINGDNPRIPQQEEIDAILKDIDYTKIILDKENNTISIPDTTMQIDTGAIAKGYITDRLVMYLNEKKVDSAILNLGGNLYLYGRKKDGSLWKVGIRDPFGLQGEYLGTVSVENLSVVTSGIYERYFEENGERYHHILNPHTGFPENNMLASVSILAESSTLADGLSTTASLLGPEEAMALIENMDGVEAIMITKDKKIYLSSGIKNGEIPFNLINKEYTVIK